MASMAMKGLWRAYCDGSGTYHADSPACVGVVICDPDGRVLCESSAHIGPGTNNMAELWAIRRALWLLRQVAPLGRHQPAVLYTDSEYAIGITTSAYRPTKNVDLAWEVAKSYGKHGAVALRHVRGHAGIPGNELADWLATQARIRAFVAAGKNPPKSRARPVGILITEHP